VKPGGAEWVDRLVRWGQRHAPQKEESRSWAGYGWCAGFLVLPVILLLEVQRRVRRHGP
jgi:hypothetical protein